MKTRVITLNTSGDRYLALKSSADTAGVELDPFSAFDARGITKESDEGKALLSRIGTYNLGDTWGMLGCTLSHLALMGEITETTLVLEDDAVLEDGFDADAIKQAVEESKYGIVYLQHHAHMGVAPEPGDPNVTRLPAMFPRVATCAYVITKEAAELFASMIEHNDDGEVVAPQIIDEFHLRLPISGIKLGIYQPYPVIHTGIESAVEASDYIGGALPKAKKEKVRIPQSLTPAQFEFSITQQESDDIDTFIGAIPDAEQKRQARIWRDKATSFDRDNPMLLQLAVMMTASPGLSDFPDTRLDEIWVNGKANAI